MKSKSLAGTEMFPDETSFSFVDYYPLLNLQLIPTLYESVQEIHQPLP